MTWSPIAARELRQATRRPRTYWYRVGATALAILFTFAVLSPSFRGFIPPNETGRALFFIVSVVAFAFCVMAGAYLTADCISEEKREGTLGLLFLTDLGGWDVVSGKLLAKALNTFYAVISIIPILAVGLLWGGVMAGEFWRMAWLLPGTLFFSAAAGLFVSAISVRGRRAWMGTIILLALFTGLPFALAYSSIQSDALLVFSPIQAFRHVFDAHYIANPDIFWTAFWVQHCAAWLFLGLASLIVPRAWQEKAPPAWLVKLREKWNRWTLGSTDNRKLDRSRWLLPNPIVWLGRRERHRRAFFWGFLGIFFAGWILGTIMAEDFWTQPTVVFGTAFILHLMIKVWLTLETTRRLADDRRSGALELLLVTPVTVPQLLTGILAGARRQFLAPVLLVLGVDLVLLITALFFPGSGWQMPMIMTFIAFIGVFLTDCYTLLWIGLWEGLTARNSTQAFLRSSLQVLVLPWALFALISAFLAIIFYQGAPGVHGWLIVTWFTTAYFADSLICGRAMHKMTTELRDRAMPSIMQDSTNPWGRLCKILPRLKWNR